MSIRHQQSGFTLIELIVVIVILGILSAVAVPKYISLETEAYDAQAKAAAGAIASASSVNYAKRLASVNTAGVQLSAAETCNDLTVWLPTGVTVSIVDTAQLLTGCGVAGAVTEVCFVKHASGTSTGFKIPVVCTKT